MIKVTEKEKESLIYSLTVRCNYCRTDIRKAENTLQNDIDTNNDRPKKFTNLIIANKEKANHELRVITKVLEQLTS